MPTSPNSLTSTATPAISGWLTQWLSRVVLPAPRDPVSKVTGMRSTLTFALKPLDGRRLFTVFVPVPGKAEALPLLFGCEPIQEMSLIETFRAVGSVAPKRILDAAGDQFQ